MKSQGRAAGSRFVPHCAKWMLGLCLALLWPGCLNPLPDDLPAEKDTPAPSTANAETEPASRAGASNDTGADTPAASPGAGGTATAVPPEGPAATEPAPEADAGVPADAGPDAARELEP